MKEHIAILGGAFDPITKGHIEIVKLVLKKCKDVDKVWIVPCYKHNFDKKTSPYFDRYNMCKIATEDILRVKASHHEYFLQTKTTYDLITKLRNKYVNFSYIIGMDNANCMNEWHKNEDLRAMIPFIVIPRKGVGACTDQHNTNWYTKKPHRLVEGNVRLISSTDIRNWTKNGDLKQAQKNLDKNVWNYIKSKGLYK